MYQLTAQDLDSFHQDTTPLIRAARNPNKAVLEILLSHFEKLDKWRQTRILNHYQENIIRGINPNTTIMLDGTTVSPTNAAVRANLPDHARLLLAAGADPNGIRRVDLADYSIRWIRGRHFQDDNNNYGICEKRTWVPENARDEKGITHPVAYAAGLTRVGGSGEVRNTKLVDMLRAAGAEESAWLQSVAAHETDAKVGTDEAEKERLFDIRHERGVPFSALSTTSPLHEAIGTGQVRMCWHLLSTCGYSPNYRPLAGPTVALPPLSYAIARCHINDPHDQK
ncbi:uncharacterized protein BDV14DRAFT_195187 [Aspergillus stella-maris]|uniref:uncharacterized protein n=1 Tax=Aspergillus stella-maris TaxID=1810926 RepID=UPI003CCE1B8F